MAFEKKKKKKKKKKTTHIHKKTFSCIFTFTRKKKEIVSMSAKNFSLCLHVIRSHNALATRRKLVIQKRLNSENQKKFSRFFFFFFFFFFLHGGSHFEIKQLIVTAKFVTNMYPDVIIYQKSKYFQLKYNYTPFFLHIV